MQAVKMYQKNTIENNLTIKDTLDTHLNYSNLVARKTADGYLHLLRI